MSNPTLDERLRALAPNPKFTDEDEEAWTFHQIRAAAAIGDSAGYARGRAEAFERAAKAVAAVDGWSRMTQDACVAAISALAAAERKDVPELRADNDRLRAEVERLKAASGRREQLCIDLCRQQRDADLERLRSTLELIARPREHGIAVCRSLARTALAALGSAPGGEEGT